jgi:Zn-dependent M28 family amino/carboxypeptidase
VIIYNEGQPGRTELLSGTLGDVIDIPVVGLSFADGNALNTAAKAGNVVMHVVTSTNSEIRPTWNLIADSTGGDEDQTLVVGSHLDSVVEGPGINDNGSGSATDLEVALQIAKLGLQPRRHLRFAFWGAEEEGLLGSTHYVNALNGTEISQIYANLNFDMVASPNYVRFVYDGDGDPTGTAGPPGSAQIEDLFNSFYAGQGMATDPTAFDGRSDYGPFIAVGIPAGGLFSGAEGVKTAEQAATYGGTAGVPYDSCYHQACDTTNNLNTKALSELSDGVAHAAWTIAKSKTGFFEDQSLTARKKGKGVKTRMKGPEAKR